MINVSARQHVWRQSTVLVAFAVLFVIVGAVTVAVAKGGDKPATVAEVVGTEWPTNEQGQTYGTMKDAATISDLPDLLGAVATNGESGYVLRTDLMRPKAATAEELAAYNEAYMKGWMIPVYEADGVKQVGVFQVGGPGTESSVTSEDGTTTTNVSNPDGTVTTTSAGSDGETDDIAGN